MGIKITFPDGIQVEARSPEEAARIVKAAREKRGRPVGSNKSKRGRRPKVGTGKKRRRLAKVTPATPEKG